MAGGSLGRWQLCFFGGVGALAPDALLLYSKRFSMPSLSFDWAQYALASIVYVSVAAVVAAILPYRGRPTPWKAFGVGVALPLLVAGAASIAASPPLVPRGEIVAGTLLDLLALM